MADVYAKDFYLFRKLIGSGIEAWSEKKENIKITVLTILGLQKKTSDKTTYSWRLLAAGAVSGREGPAPVPAAREYPKVISDSDCWAVNKY